MGLSRTDELDRIRRRGHADRGVRFAVGEDVVVFAGPRAVLPEILDFPECAAFFQRSAHQRSHRHAVPLAFTAAAHLAEGNRLGVHAAHTADKPAVTDRRERNLALHGNHERNGRVLQADGRHVVENAPVVQLAVFGRFAEHGKPRTMKQLGKDVENSDQLRGPADRLGQGDGFGFVVFGDMRLEPLVGRLQIVLEPPARPDRLDDAEHVQHRVHATFGFGREEHSVGASDLLGSSVEQHHPMPVDPAQLAVRYAPALFGRRRQQRRGSQHFQGPSYAPCQMAFQLGPVQLDSVQALECDRRVVPLREIADFDASLRVADIQRQRTLGFAEPEFQIIFVRVAF